MEVQFPPPDMQAKLKQMARDTGRGGDELVKNVVSDLLEDDALTRLLRRVKTRLSPRLPRQRP